MNVRISHINNSDEEIGCYYVSACINGKIVGFGKLTVWYDDVSVITDLYIDKKYRELGIGKMLQEYRENIALSLGFDSIFLFVDETKWMYWWYLSRGYEISSRKEGNDIWMEKMLNVK